MSQASQCDLLRQPDPSRCGIYCDTVGFDACVTSTCTPDLKWSSHPVVDRTMNTAASYAGDGAAWTPDRLLNTETVLGSVVVLRHLAIRPNRLEQKGITVTVSGIISGDTTNSSIPTRVR
jgi:hypothetical protein